MLPSRDAFLAGIRLFVRRRFRSAIALDEAAIRAALAHAVELSAGNERDEPAALFFACASRSPAFGAASRELLPMLARNQAQGIGLRLDIEDIVLTVLRARTLLRAIDFDELRAVFGAALRPFDAEPSGAPPKRPG